MKNWACESKEFWQGMTPENFQAFIKWGQSVNAKDEYGGTVFHYVAVWNQNPELIKILVNEKANVNACIDGFGYTPLHLAAYSNQNPKMITAVLEANANVKIKDIHGEMPFYYAQYNLGLQRTDALESLRVACGQ